MAQPDFLVAVDLVILTVDADVLKVLCVRRGVAPYKGRLALPGGFVRPSEDLADAAERELGEETGLSDLGGHLEQLATYGDPKRDPRGRVLSVAHLALVPDPPPATAGSDAADADWFAVEELLGSRRRLAFDHHRILTDGVARARAKLEYSPLAAAFCRSEFTIGELRQVYEAVWGAELDPRNFHRKVTKTPGFVEATGRTTTRQGGRPARLFVAGGAEVLYPPMQAPA
ncbi:MAG: NUDIX domain-containing protein [Microthrixaceae bacterium]|nr:NUDIX hydrolase [Microthrixaceae bacterium]